MFQQMLRLISYVSLNTVTFNGIVSRNSERQRLDLESESIRPLSL